MSERKEGLKAALAALATLGAGTLEPAGGGQDDLFETAAPLPMSAAKLGPDGKRRRGKNKRTEEWVSHILSQYRSPLIGLAEIYSRDARELAEELDLFARSAVTGVYVYGPDGERILQPGALLEVAKIQKAAMEALAPYLHSKQPQAIEIKGEEYGVLVLGGFGRLAGQSDGRRLPLSADQQNQRVIDVTPGQSDALASDAEAKPLRDHANA